MTMWHEFCDAVDKICEEQYDLSDGGDLCHNLLESGEIQLYDGVDRAAQAVAQRMQQP